VAALAAVTGVSLLMQPHERIPWRQDFQAASAEASRTGKPMLVDFTAPWCDACQEMRRTTWSHATVEQALREYVPVQVNVDFNQKLATQYGASALPHLAVLDPRGKVLKEIEGAMGPGEFIAWLHSSGTGPSPRLMWSGLR